MNANTVHKLLSTTLLATIVVCAAPLEVKTKAGRVKGDAKGGVVSFKGIPFAAPPVGEFRWRAPQPVAPWTGSRMATQFGPDCMQNPFPGDAAPLGTPPAEDCLYVNVWAPEGRAAQGLPVMVWFYGGGLVNGGSSPAVYDGSQFAARGVVLVSFNYRVGRFGFFAHPALTKDHADEPHGNYAYMDQIAALQWVQANISEFGGDARNVTIFGESAGGGSVLTMLTSPMANGLFHKAMVESGGGRGSLFPLRYVDRTNAQGIPSAESVGLAFAKSAGISGEDAAALAALRKLPAERVVDGLNMASMMSPTYGGPMLDGKVVVEAPDVAYQSGHGMKVPLLIGANSADIGFGRAQSKDELFAPLGAAATKAKAAYDPDGSLPLPVLTTMFAADQMMVEPSRYMAGRMASLGQPAYEYRFSYVAESMRKQWAGAPHATEIPFVFDTVEARYGKDMTTADKASAVAANEYWVNFAKTGNPNGAGLPSWPQYKPQTDQLMDFSLQGPVAKADPWKARLDLVESIAAKK